MAATSASLVPTGSVKVTVLSSSLILAFTGVPPVLVRTASVIAFAALFSRLTVTVYSCVELSSAVTTKVAGTPSFSLQASPLSPQLFSASFSLTVARGEQVNFRIISPSVLSVVSAGTVKVTAWLSSLITAAISPSVAPVSAFLSLGVRWCHPPP